MQMHTNSLNPHLTIQDWVLRSYLSKRGRKVHSVLKIKRHFFWLTRLKLLKKKTKKGGGGSTFKTSSLISHTQQVQVLEFTVSLKDKELQYAEWQHILIPITSILSDASSKDTAKEQLVFFIFCALVHWPLQY